MDGTDTSVISSLICISGVVCVFVIIGACVLGIRAQKTVQAVKSNVHGSARLANQQELSTYYYEPGRLLLGYIPERKGRRLLGLSQQQQEEHTLVVGPTGKGKSSCIIIPGLLSERGSRSVFAIDPKQELFRLTAGALAREYQVWRFAPTQAQESQKYNPLTYVSTMEDAQDLARAWIENTGQSVKHPFFDRNVELVITSAILHLREVEPTAPFSRLVDVLCLPFPHLQSLFTSSPVRAARTLAVPFLSGISGNPQLVAGLTADLASRFLLLHDAEIRQVTSANEIDFSRMGDAQAQRPVALYLSIPASQAQRLKPLSALFLMQMFKSFIRLAERNGGQLPRPIASYLDEFCNAGKIPHFESYIATLRSMRVSLLIAIQNFSQLDYVYGRDITPTILSNATTHLVLPGCGKDECDYYSSRIGDTTIEYERVSIQYRSPLSLAGSKSFTPQQVRRRLMTPDEIRTLPTGVLLMVAGACPPITMYAMPYYQTPDMLSLVGLPLP